jgi:major membrane immunogen (membrane-anchored lipoprotein)
MKKVIAFAFVLAVSTFLFTACGSKSEGTHTHDDGSTHADHSADTTKQEEFNAADTTEHQHSDSTHQHN